MFQPYNLPFAVALAVMLLLALAQLIGFGDWSPDTDMDTDGDIGIADGLTSMLGIGRLPLTMWLAVFLCVYAAGGVALQSFADSLTGAPLHAVLAGVIALVPALPVTGLLARPLGAIIPKDETTAIDRASLVGKRGVITMGRAARGSPARTCVKDRFGHPHFVMVEPHEDNVEFFEGEEVLIVRKEGDGFLAIAVEDHFLLNNA
nr:YqiJ family protein [Altericroceibacterium indicum]